MTTNSASGAVKGSAQPAKVKMRPAQALFGLLSFIAPFTIFIFAGTVRWPAAWLYIALILGISIGGRMAAAKKSPDFIAERAANIGAEGVKQWDRFIMPIVALFGPWAIYIVAGLNHRFGWPPAVSVAVQAIAFAVGIAGLLFSTWAMVENRFFSSVVRIQPDRGQTVCSSGPYAYLRHPGYAGGMVYLLTAPVMLGTLWALVPVVLNVVLVVIRTVLEDKMLQEELAGYTEYAERVRYRLLPWVW